jgi:hypothetical protein
MHATQPGLPVDRIHPLWAAEFRGYFFGDGYLGVTRNGSSRNNGRSHLVACAQITTRDDDRAMLDDVARHLGGRVSGDDWARGQQFRRPVAVWRARGIEAVTRVCDVLDGGLMPSKKRAEIAVVRRFMAIRIPPGQRAAGVDYEDLWTQREQCIAEIQRLHSYAAPVDR